MAKLSTKKLREEESIKEYDAKIIHGFDHIKKSVKVPKCKKFTFEEALDIRDFSSWYSINYFLQKTFKDDLEFDHIRKILSLYSQIWDEMLMLENQRWLEKKLDEVLDKKKEV